MLLKLAIALGRNCIATETIDEDCVRGKVDEVQHRTLFNELEQAHRGAFGGVGSDRGRILIPPLPLPTPVGSVPVAP